MADDGPVENLSPSRDATVRATTTAGTPLLPKCRLSFSSVFSAVFSWVTLVLSWGTPYWFYRRLRPDPELETSEREINNTQHMNEHPGSDSISTGDWQGRVQQLLRLWKIHQIITSTIMAPMFPLISVSPLPKCSWAYIFALLCLLHGLMTFITCVLYKEHFKAHEASTGPREVWQRSLENGFFHEDTLRFWVFLSLPSVWFIGFLAWFGMSVLMITVGERAHSDSSESGFSTICDENHMGFLRAAVCLIIVDVIANFTYMKSVARYLSVTSEGT